MKALFLEHYWIKKEIGKGNNCIVYEAVNSKTGNNIALRRFLLPPVLLESQKKLRFNSYKKELKKYFSLKHESIQETYSFFEENGDFFLESELLEGKNLSDIINENISLKLDEGVHVFLKAAEALSFAHKQGLYHKFLKPSNIFVSDDGDIKITDFGTCIFNNDEKNQEDSEDNAPSKIVSYFSPEQLNEEEFDARSEVYSLAASIYHLFTGRPPIHGDTDEELRKNIREEEPLPPSAINPNVPELLNYMLMKALSKDPDLRHRDMDDLLRDIKHLFQSGSVTNTGIRAGHIKAVKGRLEFTFRNLKQKAVEIFCQFTGKNEHQKDQKNKRNTPAEKKSKKIVSQLNEEPEIQLSPSMIADSTPRKISEREKETPVNLPLHKVKRKDNNSLLMGFVVIMGVILLFLFSVRLIGVIMQRMNNDKVQAEQTETPASAVPMKEPADYGKEKPENIDSRPVGTVNISVNVPDAVIFLQNHYDNTAQPVQMRSGNAGYINDIKLSPGVYSMKVEKEMCSPYERRIEIMANQNSNINVTLERKEPRLQVFTNPGDASVILNGSLYGKTPLTLYDVRYGKYKMIINRKGWKQETSEITIKQGTPVIINKDLAPEKSTGSRGKEAVKNNGKRPSISIFSSPEGANVYLDEKDLGLTPVHRSDVKPGIRNIRISKKGYRSIEREINIPKSLSRDYYFDLSPAAEQKEKTSVRTPLHKSHPDSGDYYPTEKPDYSKVGQRLKNVEEKPQEKKKVRLITKMRFIPGVAYDKLDRKIITVSFDTAAIEKRLDKIISQFDYIELADSGFNTDLELKLHFAVGVNTRNLSSKPELTLYSAVMVLNFHTKTVLYSKTEEVNLEYPEGTSLEVDHNRGHSLHSGRYINTDKTTPEINLFLEKKLIAVLKEMKEYDPDRTENYADPARDAGNHSHGDSDSYRPGVPPEDRAIPSEYKDDRDYFSPSP